MSKADTLAPVEDSMQGVEATSDVAPTGAGSDSTVASGVSVPISAPPAADKPSGPELDGLTPEQARRRAEAYDRMKKIEKEFEEIKRRLFEEKLTEIRDEVNQVQQDSHRDLKEEIDRLQKVRDEKVKASERLKELQLECLERVFAAEKKQADDEFDADRTSLKTRWQQFLLNKSKRLEEERDAFDLSNPDAPDTEVSGRGAQFRGKRKKADNAAQQPVRRGKIQPQGIAYKLAETQIDEDITLMLGTQKGGPSGSLRAAGARRKETA